MMLVNLIPLFPSYYCSASFIVGNKTANGGFADEMDFNNTITCFRINNGFSPIRSGHRKGTLHCHSIFDGLQWIYYEVNAATTDIRKNFKR